MRPLVHSSSSLYNRAVESSTESAEPISDQHSAATPQDIAAEGDRVLLIHAKGKRFAVTLRAGFEQHTHKGVIRHDDLIGQPLGRQVYSHLGQAFAALRPTIHDELMGLKRQSQIIYPKELGMILLKLDVTSGSRVVEAGTGSGALTTALANAVRPDGMVYSYDAREDMLGTAHANLTRLGLAPFVTLAHRDIAEGFGIGGVDAVFLDVREPWFYLRQVQQALKPGGCFGAIVPTTNQVSELLDGLLERRFIEIEALEILERQYKPLPGRLRPRDQMVGHTGYLVFARSVQQSIAPRKSEQATTGPEQMEDS